MSNPWAISDVLRSALPVLVVLGAAQPGCAPYTRVNDLYRVRSIGLEVPLPQGWLRYRGGGADYVMTADGLRLERISIVVHKMRSELEGTDRTYQPHMLPQELAEVAVGVLQARRDYSNFELQRIEPAAVGGRDGYRAVASYQDDAGLQHTLQLVGVAVAGRVCEFTFAAADLVYYDKHLPAFENMITSIRLPPPTSGI